MAQRPIHEISIGRIIAAIWKNETENGPRFNISLSRVYRTDDGWESSDSFGRDDLPLVAKVADAATRRSANKVENPRRAAMANSVRSRRVRSVREMLTSR